MVYEVTPVPGCRHDTVAPESFVMLVTFDGVAGRLSGAGAAMTWLNATGLLGYLDVDVIGDRQGAELPGDDGADRRRRPEHELAGLPREDDPGADNALDLRAAHERGRRGRRGAPRRGDGGVPRDHVSGVHRLHCRQRARRDADRGGPADAHLRGHPRHVEDADLADLGEPLPGGDGGGDDLPDG